MEATHIKPLHPDIVVDQSGSHIDHRWSLQSLYSAPGGVPSSVVGTGSRCSHQGAHKSHVNQMTLRHDTSHDAVDVISSIQDHTTASWQHRITSGSNRWQSVVDKLNVKSSYDGHRGSRSRQKP